MGPVGAIPGPQPTQASSEAVDASLDVLWSEGDLLAFVRRTARLSGWMAYHTAYSVQSEPGFPDMVLVRPPRVIFAELKTGKGRLTAGHVGRSGRWVTGQQEWLEALRQCPGVETYLWRPADVDAIADLLKPD